MVVFIIKSVCQHLWRYSRSENMPSEACVVGKSAVKPETCSVFRAFRILASLGTDTACDGGRNVHFRTIQISAATAPMPEASIWMENQSAHGCQRLSLRNIVVAAAKMAAICLGSVPQIY